MCVPHSFTVEEIAEILYKTGASEDIIAAEICGLLSLFDKTVNYEKLTSIMAKAKESYGRGSS